MCVCVCMRVRGIATREFIVEHRCRRKSYLLLCRGIEQIKHATFPDFVVSSFATSRRREGRTNGSSSEVVHSLKLYSVTLKRA